MPRTLCRVLAVAAMLGVSALAAGQSGNLKDFRMEGKPPADPSGKLGQFREGKLRTTGPDLKANQELLRSVAKFHVYKATDDKYYLPSESGDLRPRETAGTFDQVLIDVGAQLLQPGPDTKYTTAQQEYLNEFGAALNEAIRDVLKNNPPSPIRVNCGRLLALGAKSGAPAFAGTIHELLTNTFPFAKNKPERMPPELLHYAIRAAGNLFGAYDPVWHLNTDWKSQYRHSFDPKDQLTLARDLLNLLAKGPGVADLAAPDAPDTPVYRGVRQDGSVAPEATPAAGQAKLDAAAPSSEQAQVTAYFRRQVAAAVSKIRPDLLSEVGQPPVRTGVAVAQIAVGDASLNPPVTTPEVAEAVIGLCYLAPSQNLNIPEVLAAIAAGAQAVARDYDNRKSPAVARTAQLVPWRVYAERLNTALDHLSRQATQNPRWRDHRPAVGQLVSVLREDLIPAFRRPEDDTLKAAVSNRLTDFLRDRQTQPKAARSLYTDDDKFTLTPRSAGR